MTTISPRAGPGYSDRTIKARDTDIAAGFTFDDRWTPAVMRTDWLDEIELRQPDAVPVITAATMLHEFGHTLGLPDFPQHIRHLGVMKNNHTYKNITSDDLDYLKRIYQGRRRQ